MSGRLATSFDSMSLSFFSVCCSGGGGRPKFYKEKAMIELSGMGSDPMYSSLKNLDVHSNEVGRFNRSPPSIILCPVRHSSRYSPQSYSQ